MKKNKSGKKFKAVSLCFIAVLFAGATVGLFLPLRPEYSESEKRELTKFPEFSVEALIDGSFFSGVSTWYADTFPFREMFINANSKIKSFYGIGNTISGFSDEIGEEIPELPPEGYQPATQPGLNEQATQQTTAVPETTTENKKEPIVQKLSNILIADNAGYEYYSFVRATAESYASAVSTAADNLKGTSRVFAMVVPTSMDITLDDSVRKDVNTSNQRDAINYINKVISPNAIKVDTFDAIKAHRDEYVYFRTDHHWTALGAYYAYVEYTKAAGLQTAQLTDFEEKVFDGFVGSFYNDSGKNPVLEKEPDTVYAYAPPANVTLTYTDKKGNNIKWDVITDVTDWSKGTKYNTFCAGDQPYSRIVNPNITDGSSCIVVKESFGNAMIPFLTANYSEIHVIDYRYWNGNLIDFARDNGVDDVIYVNNISATRNKSLVNSLHSIV